MKKIKLNLIVIFLFIISNPVHAAWVNIDKVANPISVNFTDSAVTVLNQDTTSYITNWDTSSLITNDTFGARQEGIWDVSVNNLDTDVVVSTGAIYILNPVTDISVNNQDTGMVVETGYVQVTNPVTDTDVVITNPTLAVTQSGAWTQSISTGYVQVTNPVTDLSVNNQDTDIIVETGSIYILNPSDSGVNITNNISLDTASLRLVDSDSDEWDIDAGGAGRVIVDSGYVQITNPVTDLSINNQDTNVKLVDTFVAIVEQARGDYFADSSISDTGVTYTLSFAAEHWIFSSDATDTSSFYFSFANDTSVKHGKLKAGETLEMNKRKRSVVTVWVDNAIFIPIRIYAW